MTQASMARSLREIANALESGPWVHQGELSTHLMFVKIGIWEVQLHKGWKCHRRHSWLSQIQNTVLKADLSQAWAAWHGRHQLQAFLTSQTNGFKAFHFPLTSQEAHSIIQGLQPHHGLVPELWSLSNITQRLVDQNNILQVLRVEILKNLLQDLCGTLESLSSGQVSTSAIGNLAMKVSTFWRILGVTSPVHSPGHWQSLSDSLPYLLESWSLKLNKLLRLSHIL